jgi:hypothetical protein
MEMDPTRFDDLTKALATPTSRRQALRRIGATLSAAMLATWPFGRALASNSACAHFCDAVFGPDTPAASQCISDAAHGKGLCHQCGSSAPSSICCSRNSSGYCSSYSNAQCSCDSGHCLKCDSASATCISACGPNQVCQNGQCVTPCTTIGGSCSQSGDCCSGACCNGTCTDLSSNNNNCGTCGNICDACSTCQSGTCVSSCPSGQACLNGTCCEACSGSTICPGPCGAPGCNGNPNCFCRQRVEGGTSCGASGGTSGVYCIDCSTDSDCVATGLGTICVKCNICSSSINSGTGCATPCLNS